MEQANAIDCRNNFFMGNFSFFYLFLEVREAQPILQTNFFRKEKEI